MADDLEPTATRERAGRESERGGAAANPARIDESDLIGTIETDRFCEHCSFNMRSAPVFREPRSQVLMVRCTECGRLHAATALTSASRVWLSRLASMLMLGWVVFAMAFLLFAGLLETAMHGITLDEAVSYRRGGNAVLVRVSEDSEFRALVMTVYPVSLALGFLTVTLVGVAASHWKWWGYVALAALLPLIPAAIAWNITRRDTPEFLGELSVFIGWHFAAQVAGGLLGALFGRPVVRLVVKLLVPPRLRSALAFLWLADRLPPPGVAVVKPGASAAR